MLILLFKGEEARAATSLRFIRSFRLACLLHPYGERRSDIHIKMDTAIERATNASQRPGVKGLRNFQNVPFDYS